jgi:hypothetical protein
VIRGPPVKKRSRVLWSRRAVVLCGGDNCHVYEWLCRRGFGLDIAFIDHFNTQLAITLNYSAIADLHTLQITSVLSLLQLPLAASWWRLLTVAIPLPLWMATSFQLSVLATTNWLPQTVPVVISQHGPHRKHCSVAVQLIPWENVCLRSRYSATALV